MTTDEKTIAIYVAHLHGSILVVHGTTPKEATVAKQLAESLKALGTRETECLAVSVKELSHAVGKAGHVILVFNSMDNLTKKLCRGEEFTAQVGRMRPNHLVAVCKASQIPKYSPLIHFMQFSFDEDVKLLAVKCLTIFGGDFSFS